MDQDQFSVWLEGSKLGDEKKLENSLVSLLRGSFLLFGGGIDSFIQSDYQNVLKDTPQTESLIPFLVSAGTLHKISKCGEISESFRKKAIALVLAYRFHLEELLNLYHLFVASKMRSSSFDFLVMRDGLECGLCFAAKRCSSLIIAVSELLFDHRVEYLDNSSSVCAFFCIFMKMNRDLRSIVLKKLIVDVFSCIDYSKDHDYVVCKDTVGVWMRCFVLSRKEDSVFVRYEHWSDRWDEDIKTDDVSRLKAWVDPTLRVSAFNDFQPKRSHIENAKVDLLCLLRNEKCQWQCRSKFL